MARIFLSIENVGWVRWVVVEFHLLWIESDYELYRGFYHEYNAQIFCVQFFFFFCFILQFSFYKQGKKSKLCRVVFLYVVVLAEQ